MDIDLLRKAQRELRERYRSGQGMTSEAHRAVYRTARKPATTAVIRRLLGHLEIGTYVDLGAGEGASLDALNYERAILIERDPNLTPSTSDNVTLLREDFTRMASYPKCDLILASYSLNEVDYAPVLPKMIEAADTLCIIEPGTPEGSERILLIRDFLISAGLHILAPCPHHKTCPMPWCHFSERIQRTREHKHVKDGTRGFEDEKYAYLIASKTPRLPEGDRIVRHPRTRKGHTIFTLCKVDGTLQEETLSRKDPRYKAAKKLGWGDTLA